MKTAKKGNEILHLDRLNRSSYQQLHDEGKKGLLECPVCSEIVVLFLGIDKDPHFEHKITKKPACQDGESIKLQFLQLVIVEKSMDFNSLNQGR